MSHPDAIVGTGLRAWVVGTGGALGPPFGAPGPQRSNQPVLNLALRQLRDAARALDLYLHVTPPGISFWTGAASIETRMKLLVLMKAELHP